MEASARGLPVPLAQQVAQLEVLQAAGSLVAAQSDQAVPTAAVPLLRLALVPMLGFGPAVAGVAEGFLVLKCP